MKSFLLICTLAAFHTHAQTPVHKKQFDSLFASYFEPGKPGGAVLVVKEGKIIYQKGFGIADIKTKEPITTNTLFNIGSITKPIVAMGILQLARERKLSLDDNIYKYFPDFKNKEIAQKVKIYHLLTHTSGLPDSRQVSAQHEFYLTAKDEENWAPIKQTDTLVFEPGTGYRYSNPAFNGLALIIEKLVGKKWQEYIKQIVFTPAGMLTSTITDGPHPLSGVAHSYVMRGNNLMEMDYGEEATFAAAGNGGVWSSVEELWQLEQAIQQYRLLDKKWTDLSRTVYPFPGWKDKTPPRLGLSWVVDKTAKLPMIGHTGSQGGFISDYCWWPEQKIFYVLLCNIPKPILEIRMKVLDIIK